MILFYVSDRVITFYDIGKVRSNKKKKLRIPIKNLEKIDHGYHSSYARGVLNFNEVR